MKLFLLIVVSFIFINKTYSQNAIEIKIEIGRKRKITKVDVEGSFSGGDTALRERITKRLSTSKFVAKGAKRGWYTVKLRYIVAKDGNIADVECIDDPGYGLAQEAIGAVKVAAWNPAGSFKVRPYKH